MLALKIKPCMFQSEPHGRIANGSLQQSQSTRWTSSSWLTSEILEIIHARHPTLLVDVNVSMESDPEPLDER